MLRCNELRGTLTVQPVEKIAECVLDFGGCDSSCCRLVLLASLATSAALAVLVLFLNTISSCSEDGEGSHLPLGSLALRLRSLRGGILALGRIEDVDGFI
jgi:hypothetical protein